MIDKMHHNGSDNIVLAWIFYVTSFIVHAIPYIQFISLLLASTASVIAIVNGIKTYKKGLKNKKSNNG